ncbi:hypothetical protein CYMTET_43339 [Cymbomonas tetramitiformis]|uniref:Uncharacterized protein n=1 Tax=Cymbomonas tetramitiformis TaxID=36881 RepID=A0AAE0C293_9CHLO|nr:hypothetical protein CYMTET_43339 [Cymbomonas tetramitiformis]
MQRLKGAAGLLNINIQEKMVSEPQNTQVGEESYEGDEDFHDAMIPYEVLKEEAEAALSARKEAEGLTNELQALRDQASREAAALEAAWLQVEALAQDLQAEERRIVEDGGGRAATVLECELQVAREQNASEATAVQDSLLQLEALRGELRTAEERLSESDAVATEAIELTDELKRSLAVAEDRLKRCNSEARRRAQELREDLKTAWNRVSQQSASEATAAVESRVRIEALERILSSSEQAASKHEEASAGMARELEAATADLARRERESAELRCELQSATMLPAVRIDTDEATRLVQAMKGEVQEARSDAARQTAAGEMCRREMESTRRELQGAADEAERGMSAALLEMRLREQKLRQELDTAEAAAAYQASAADEARQQVGPSRASSWLFARLVGRAYGG